MSVVVDCLRLVKFSHSIFALPFALSSAWLAAGGVPAPRVLGLIVLCAVAARTAAMGFNRLVDRKLDARNPRTAGRELPRGVLAPGAVALLVLVSSLVFVGGAFALNRVAGLLSLPVLACLLGYSFAKRVTWLAHGVLGLCLGLAPLGAWVAVKGAVAGDLTPPLLLAGAVLTWVAGFDLIYACQDVGFDRGAGLHSVPARFGVPRALGSARALHAVTVALLAAFAWRAGLSWIFWLAVLLAAALLVWEHGLVRADDLSRVDMAFFTLNGWVGVALFIGLALDLEVFGVSGGAGARMSAARKPGAPPEQLAALERSEDLPRAALVRGEEGWFRDRAVELLRKRGEAAGLELCTHDGRDPDFDPAAVVGDLTSASLFGGSRLVIVRGADGPLTTRGKEPTPLTKAVQAFCGSSELEGALVLEAERLRKDHKAAKAVAAAGGPVLDCRKLWDSPAPWERNPDPTKTELARWTLARAREGGLRLDPRQAAYVAALVGNDLGAIDDELEKLQHLGPAALKEIALRAGGAPWTAAQALAREAPARGLAAVEALYRAGFHGKDGKRELDSNALTAMLLGSLAREVRQGLAAARALAASDDEAAAAVAAGYKGPPGGRGVLIAAARRRSPARWRAMLDDVVDCERRMKSGAPVGAADFALLAVRWRP